MQSDENKREFSRVEIHMEAELSADGYKSVLGKLHDVSMNGLCLEGKTEMKVGEACRVKILLGDPQEPIAIHVQGEISRRLASSLAITFTSIDPDSYLHLQNLVFYNAEDTERVEQEFTEHFGIKRKA